MQNGAADGEEAAGNWGDLLTASENENVRVCDRSGYKDTHKTQRTHNADWFY